MNILPVNRSVQFAPSFRWLAALPLLQVSILIEAGGCFWLLIFLASLLLLFFILCLLSFLCFSCNPAADSCGFKQAVKTTEIAPRRRKWQNRKWQTLELVPSSTKTNTPARRTSLGVGVGVGVSLAPPQLMLIFVVVAARSVQIFK